jgi:hydrogenase expression/formation protein HypD
MRFVDEFRNPAVARRLAGEILRRASRRRTIMEVCGGQTHSIVQNALDELVGDRITLLHGPGCPVCVTPLETLDRARRLALETDAILCSFGDMLRVPGSAGDLATARARGADVRVVYSPLDAARLAERTPARPVVFLAVGFETTAPAVATAARWAAGRGLPNFFLLVSHVRVPPALEAICGSGAARPDAFLAAGHVCTVMGTDEYEPIARRFRVPIVATGFEPTDILQGIALAVAQLERGEARVEIQYDRAVRPAGNPVARELLEEVFEVVDRPWRGLGTIARGGLALRGPYARLDALRAFPELARDAPSEPAACRAGEVLRGVIRPTACSEYGRGCTPDHPLGAPMVSSEGACAAYYHYRSDGGGP